MLVCNRGTCQSTFWQSLALINGVPLPEGIRLRPPCFHVLLVANVDFPTVVQVNLTSDAVHDSRPCFFWFFLDNLPMFWTSWRVVCCDFWPVIFCQALAFCPLPFDEYAEPMREILPEPVRGDSVGKRSCWLEHVRTLL